MRYDLSTTTLRVRDVYRIGYDVLRRNGMHMLLMFFVSVVPAGILETMLNAHFDVNLLDGSNAGFGLLSTSAAWLLNVIAMIYLMRLTAEDVRENDVTALKLFTVVGRIYIPMLISYILFLLTLLVGLVLFIVPGIIVMVLLAFYPAFMVIENDGIFRSFGNSIALVKRHFFHVLGMSIALIFPVLMVTFLLEAAASNDMSRFLALLVGNTLMFYYIIMITVFFLNVRKTWKETAVVESEEAVPEGTPQ